MIWRAQMCWFHLVSNSCRNNALSAGAASSRGLALQRSLWSLPPSTALHPSYRGLNSGYDFGNTCVIRRLGLGLCESAPGSKNLWEKIWIVDVQIFVGRREYKTDLKHIKRDRRYTVIPMIDQLLLFVIDQGTEGRNTCMPGPANISPPTTGTVPDTRRKRKRMQNAEG